MSDTSAPPETPAELTMTVLFVDEDPDFLDLASRLLELETDRIDLVPEPSPRDALDRLEEFDVDCVVSDYMMTEMDGLELLERVRSQHPAIPFILFTGKGGEEIASEAISAGATDYIVKTGSPDQYAVLANRIEKAVARTRAEARTTRQQHLSTIVQTMTNDVIHQPTRDGIEGAACEGLLAVDPYAFVQISAPAAGEGSPLRIRTWAVDDATGVDPDPIIDAVGTGARSPERTAHETGDPVVVNDLHEEQRFAEWRSPVRESGLASVLCVPITYGDISYGAISIYASIPGVFNDVELTTFGGLGELLGFAISSAELRRGMFSFTMTEIELTVRGSSARFLSLARALESRVTVETIVPRPDGQFSMSLVIEDPPAEQERTEEAIRGTLSPDEATLSTADGGVSRWAVVTGTRPVDRFEDRGIRINYLTATEESERTVLTAPPDIAVRDVVDMAESQFEAVELTERRDLTERQRPAPTAAGIAEELTSRQTEVLETAYRHGFFEWPREMNTEEIATLLGMSQPALSRHLRNIQRTIAESLVDEAPRKPASD